MADTTRDSIPEMDEHDSVPTAAREEHTGPWFTVLSKAVFAVIISLVVAGIYAATTIPIAVFPTTNFPRVVIAIDNGVMPIDQMMVTITLPIEEAVNVVQGLQRVRSITSRGSAEVDLFFDWNIDMFSTLQRVNAAMSRAQLSLPPSVKIDVQRLRFSSFPILAFGITSDTIPNSRLWEIATYEIKPRINRVNGVSSVLIQGDDIPEYDIVPDPGKLLRAGITVQDILGAVQRTNLVQSPGLIESHHQLVLQLLDSQVHNPGEISSIVVKKSSAGVPIQVGDIASVNEAKQPLYTVVTSNGKPGVLLSINRQPGANTVSVDNGVYAELNRIRQGLPPGIHFSVFYDQGELVQEAIRSVRDAILIGILLATLVIIVFLKDWGSSLVAGLVIPITVAVTCIFLKLLGQSFNLMTLGGLAAAVGLVIDDAIVVIENIVIHRDAGQGRVQAIRSSLAELKVPLLGSTATPVVIFLPLILISGVPGTFFKALA